MSGEMSIFDFNVQDVVKEEVEVKKDETKKPKVLQGQTSAGVKKFELPKPEDIKVQGDWTIHIGVDTFSVTDFIEFEITEEGVSLEEIRSEMEKVFFQFSKSRTKWDMDKDNKRLFPDAYGAAKG
ncbi:hypothetical protein [Peribacillus asahii]|uniref:hypothetical protein n=1 Tax=Peribacillus asahii TaxID=228899 RepID=UPI002079760F|nr:hypothetical protein [Peribacillus asahii]USK62234.1 hypothetical protein LIT37_23970 [Peribacillus asahii]